MSTHPIAASPGATRAQQETVVHEAWELASAAIRPCTIDWDQLALVFTPDLSTAEQGTLADIAVMVKFGVEMTLAEWQSIKADAAGLKTYLGVASPTLAQTASATKAIIRVLGVIVRS